MKWKKDILPIIGAVFICVGIAILAVSAIIPYNPCENCKTCSITTGDIFNGYEYISITKGYGGYSVYASEELGDDLVVCSNKKRLEDAMICISRKIMADKGGI